MTPADRWFMVACTMTVLAVLAQQKSVRWYATVGAVVAVAVSFMTET